MEDPDKKAVRKRMANPCCMPLQFGLYVVATTEIFVYSMALGFYIYWLTVINTIDKDWWGRQHYFWERREAKYSDESTTNLIRAIAIGEIIVCSLYIIFAIVLIIGAIKRIGTIGVIWIIAVCVLTLTRLTFLFITPIFAYQIGLIWVIFELYFMFVVGSFVIEVKYFPDGVTEDDLYGPFTPLYDFDPIYGRAAYPLTTGYVVVPVVRRAQGQGGGERVEGGKVKAFVFKNESSGQDLAERAAAEPSGAPVDETSQSQEVQGQGQGRKAYRDRKALK